MLGEAEPLKLASAPNHQFSELRIAIRNSRSEIGYTCSLVGRATEYPVEAGPALGPDFALQGEAYFLFAARAKFKRDALLGARSEPAADVVAADDKILAVITAAAHQDMNMGIVGIPMIDCHPVQPGVEITFGIGHQFAGKGAKVRHLGSVLRRDCEPEMMPIILAPLRKSLGIGTVRPGIEHLRVGAVAGNALALEICDVF